MKKLTTTYTLCQLILFPDSSFDHLLAALNLPLGTQGRIQGGWIGWISTPHFSVKKKIRNVTLFEIENKERKKN